jgi:hypothetical protein
MQALTQDWDYPPAMLEMGIVLLELSLPAAGINNESCFGVPPLESLIGGFPGWRTHREVVIARQVRSAECEGKLQVMSRICCIGTALSVALPVLHAGPSLVRAQDSTPLQYRYLWDSDSRNRPEWQLVGRTAGYGPAGMIWGKEGEIFLADPENSRVLHITREGNLQGIIGRRGQGHGEFEYPRGLGFEKSTGVLWVLDFDGFGISKRCSRFESRDGTYVLRDSVILQSTRHDLIVDQEDSFWRSGLSTQSSSGRTERKPGRIRLMDLRGNVLREFGPSWAVEEESPWSMLGTSALNEGRLIELSGGRLAWLWLYRPIIEVWSKEGVLIAERGFGSPFSDLPQPVRDNQGIVHSVGIFSIAAYDEEGDVLFIKAPLEGERGARYLGLDTRTLEEKESYYITRPSDAEKPMTESNILVERVAGAIRFYSIDIYSHALVVLYPE